MKSNTFWIIVSFKKKLVLRLTVQSYLNIQLKIGILLFKKKLLIKTSPQN